MDNRPMDNRPMEYPTCFLFAEGSCGYCTEIKNVESDNNWLGTISIRDMLELIVSLREPQFIAHSRYDIMDMCNYNSSIVAVLTCSKVLQLSITSDISNKQHYPDVYVSIAVDIYRLLSHYIHCKFMAQYTNKDIEFIKDVQNIIRNNNNILLAIIKAEEVLTIL